jgi:hypothetical protein
MQQHQSHSVQSSFDHGFATGAAAGREAGPPVILVLALSFSCFAAVIAGRLAYLFNRWLWRPRGTHHVTGDAYLKQYRKEWGATHQHDDTHRGGFLGQ